MRALEAGKPSEIKALTALRGVAAWWVVLYHFREVTPGLQDPLLVSVVDHGYLAVDLFFILSGFVISLNHGVAFHSFSWATYLTFIWARIARIYPLHVFIMLLYLSNPLLILLFSSQKTLGHRYDLGYYVLSLFLLQNWGFTGAVAWNVPAWSISTEFCAYLSFPLLWMAASRIAQRGRLEIVTALVLAMLAAMGCLVLGTLGGHIERFGLARCLLEWSLGLLLLLLVQSARLPSGNQALLILILLVGIGLPLGFPDYLVAPASSMLLIAALLDKADMGARILNRAPLVWLGEISYSTYLVHYLIRDWIKFALLRPGVDTALVFSAYLTATFAVSPILYYVVERPGRRFLRDIVLLKPDGTCELTTAASRLEPNKAP